jgi:hypothetical protein
MASVIVRFSVILEIICYCNLIYDLRKKIFTLACTVRVLSAFITCGVFPSCSFVGFVGSRCLCAGPLAVAESIRGEILDATLQLLVHVSSGVFVHL